MQLGNAVVSLFVVVTQTLFAQWYQESIDKQDVVDRTTLCVIEQFVRRDRQNPWDIYRIKGNSTLWAETRNQNAEFQSRAPILAMSKKRGNL